MDTDTMGMNWPQVSRQETEEWGLTREKLAEVKAELNDHVTCLEGDAGADAAEETKEQLEAPATRRKLAGVHITDQVVATLNRWPTKIEWRELAWLGMWYVLIMLSDQLAAHTVIVAEKVDLWPGSGWYFSQADFESSKLASYASYYPWATASWLLQGVARAGFFASFALCLWRAYKVGWGVLLARLLQLKLIHTVLVLIGCAIIGNQFSRISHEPYALPVDWPFWLGAGYVAGALAVLAAAIVLFRRSRGWVLATGMLLTALFLYPGGASQIDINSVTLPLVTKIIEHADGTRERVPETDPAIIRERGEERYNWSPPPVKDVENNTVTFPDVEVAAALGSYWASQAYPPLGVIQESNSFKRSSYYEQYATSTPVNTYLSTPVAVPGAGLGWLAAPIPILGIIGLVAMVFLMGRRGPVHALLYAIICFAAITSTILPFMLVGQAHWGDGLWMGMYDLTPSAVVISPCPSFEMLLAGPALIESWSVILGLLLSAGAPWLLTALFLKQKPSMPNPDDLAVAE